jgi:hypothetical protein
VGPPGAFDAGGARLRSYLAPRREGCPAHRMILQPASAARATRYSARPTAARTGRRGGSDHPRPRHSRDGSAREPPGESRTKAAHPVVPHGVPLVFGAPAPPQVDLTTTCRSILTSSRWDDRLRHERRRDLLRRAGQYGLSFGLCGATDGIYDAVRNVLVTRPRLSFQFLC